VARRHAYIDHMALEFPKRPRVDPPRRLLLGAGLGLLALSARPLRAAEALIATPRQSEGPFYPREIPLDHDNDLTHVAGQAASASGTPIEVVGRLLALDGRPLQGAAVEIWQCDAFGVYHHVGHRGAADAAFQGYGRMTVGVDGGYRFRTIRPVPYPGRTPHIHFAVSGGGLERFTTQMYLAGEPRNDRDGILNAVRDAAARARLIVALEPAGPGLLAGRFDIVLGLTPHQG